ncbi:MAG: PAS domain S-box protein, partial [Campylobacterota bacterium]|nr:PAS domain S-box protein [Campylobacterota bacterium]
MIVTAIAAASLATLVSVFHIFVAFISFQMLMFISASIYRGGEMFYLIAVLGVAFLGIVLANGYRQYIALKNSISMEDTFKTIYNKSTDGIALIQNNRFRDCNEAVIKMFKYDSIDDVLNRDISELMPKYQPDGQSSVKKMLKKMKEAYKNGFSEVEWLHKTTKGDEFWAQITLTYIHLDGEDLLHGAWRDITDRKKLEEEAKQTAIYLQNLNTSLEYKIEEAVKEIKKQERV